VGLEHLAHPERPAELQQPLVLVGGVDQHGVAALLATQDEHVVVHGADDHLVDLGLGVLVVQSGHGV
jgi:hypothetical protein